MLQTHGPWLRKYLIIWVTIFVGWHFLWAGGYVLAGFYLRFGLEDYWNGPWPPMGLPGAAAAQIQEGIADSAASIFALIILAAMLFFALREMNRRRRDQDDRDTTEQSSNRTKIANIRIKSGIFVLIGLAFLIALDAVIIAVMLYFLLGRKLWESIIFDQHYTMEQPLNNGGSEDRDDRNADNHSSADQLPRVKKFLVNTTGVAIGVLLIALIFGISFLGFLSEYFLIESIPTSAMEFFNEDPALMQDYLIKRGNNVIPIFVSAVICSVFFWIMNIVIPKLDIRQSPPPPA